jgi:hypothetical protein
MAKPFITQLLPYCIDQAEEEVVTADEQAFISIFVLKII